MHNTGILGFAVCVFPRLGGVFYSAQNNIYSVHRLILFLAVLFVAGCLSEGEATVYTVSGKPELALCNQKPSVDERENCYMAVAVEKSSAPLCEEICSVRIHNLCVLKLAKKVANPNLCQQIRNDDWRYTDCVSSAHGDWG